MDKYTGVHKYTSRCLEPPLCGSVKITRVLSEENHQADERNSSTATKPWPMPAACCTSGCLTHSERRLASLPRPEEPSVSHLDIWGVGGMGAGAGGVCTRITVQERVLDLLAFHPYGSQGITRNSPKPDCF